MKTVITWCMVIMAATLLSACSKESTPPEETAKPAATETGTVAEEAKEAVAETKEAADVAVDAAKTEAEQQVQAAEEAAAKLVEETKTTAAQTVDAVKEQTAAAVEETKEATDKAVDSATATAAAAAAAVQEAATPESPGVVVYEAGTMGKVTFNHADHGSRLSCDKCHPTDPPRMVEINKDIAHTLCTGCHKASGGNAPTSCTACHVK